MRAFWYFAIGVFCALAASGQAIVEHSVATAGTTAAAGGMKDTGKSIGGVFRVLTTRSGQSKQSVKPVPPSPPIDPSQVTEGLDRAELIKRFGEPVLRFSERRNSQLVERVWYNTTTPDQVEIKLIGDKVASVRGPANTKRDPPHN
jgi:hypothetical protein